MKKIIIFCASTLVLFVVSCSNKNSEKENSAEWITVKKVFSVVDLSDNAETGQEAATVKEGRILIQALYDQFMAGKIKAYDSYEFKKEITGKQFLALFERTDSVTMPNPLNPEKDTLMVIKSIFNPKDICGIGFMEEWKLDKVTLKFEKKILGFSPVRSIYTVDPATGDQVFKGWGSTFFLKPL